MERIPGNYLRVAALAMIFLLSAGHAQENDKRRAKLAPADSLLMTLWPALPVPEFYLSENAPSLPPQINNASLPWFPPVFSQDGWSCGQSAGIGYNYTYEINASRNAPGDSLFNQYQPHYTWNIYNDGLFEQGVCYYYSFELIKAAGHPDKTCFGNGVNYLTWMNGYENYHEAMFNRIQDVYSIYTGDLAGITVLKHWINDHLNGSEYGGVASFYSDGYQSAHLLPSGTPEEGKAVVTQWGAYTGHAMTIVGYNDSIRYDYNEDGLYTDNPDLNGDGKIDLADKETGGFMFVNSFGVNWADSGFCYMMYKTLAGKKPEAGIWNQSVQVLDIREDYSPLLTLKTKITHTCRNKLKIMAGVSPGDALLCPLHVMEFDHFHYRGGRNHMLGDTSQAAMTLETGLDITPLLSYVEPGLPARFFLMIMEDDPQNEGSGIIHNLSLMDYTGGATEIPCEQQNVPVNNHETTMLSVVHTVNFDKPEITTEAFPPFAAGAPFGAQLTARKGRPPYRWELNCDYSVSADSATFPSIDEQKIITWGGGNLWVKKTLPFQFPFHNELHQDVTVHSSGFITFSGYELPIPYQTDDRILFRLLPVIAPWLNSKFYINQGKNDGVWYKEEAGRAAFRWKVSFDKACGGSETLEFALVLHSSGNIEFYYLINGVPAEAKRFTGLSGGPEKPGTEQDITINTPICQGKKIVLCPPFLPASYSMTETGIFSCIPDYDSIIYDIPVTVTDYNGISSRESIQLSAGMTYSLLFPGGNENVLTAGEAGTLGITLRNNGAQALNCQWIEIAVSDPYIHFPDDSEAGGIIAPGGSLTLPDAFKYNVYHHTPDLHKTDLSLRCITDSKTLTGKGKITVFSTAAEIFQLIVDDGNDQRLDPGETATLVFGFRNTGHAPAYSLWTDVTAEEEFIELAGNPLAMELLLPGESLTRSLEVTAGENTPEGMYLLHYDLSWYPAMVKTGDIDLPVGKNGCFVIDLDPARFSGPVLDSLLRSKQIQSGYSNGFPEEINHYAAVFVCLGGVLEGIPLTAWQGEVLKEYLLSGGHLYMEGARTWYNDPATPVHSMFGASPVYINWQQYDTIHGMDGSFGEGFRSAYDSGKPYFEYLLQPDNTAVSLLGSGSENHNVAVARDNGNYRTIASEPEFGGIFQGGGPAVADTLLSLYLEFFGIGNPPSSVKNVNASSPLTVMTYPNPFKENMFVEISSPFTCDIQVVIRDATGTLIREVFTGKVGSEKKQIICYGKNSADEVTAPGLFFICIYWCSRDESENLSFGKKAPQPGKDSGYVVKKILKL
ncbi:MAG: hypothetical protein JXA03_12340 [Bacteroidales bacterium]|nr:hypothetical protein [Bacteroidales bacterium]